MLFNPIQRRSLRRLHPPRLWWVASTASCLPPLHLPYLLSAAPSDATHRTADWTDDLNQFCAAAPHGMACTLWKHCKVGRPGWDVLPYPAIQQRLADPLCWRPGLSMQEGMASGRFCSVPSLAASACKDIPAVGAG